MILFAVIFLICSVLLIIWKYAQVPLLECLFIWLVVSTINLNVFDILTGNLKLIEITKQMQMFWASFLNRHLLIPLLVVLFIDKYESAKSAAKKVGCFVLWVLMLAALQYAASWAGIIKFVNWKFSWSMAEWAGVMLATLYCRVFFHCLLRKGGISRDSGSSGQI